MFEYFIYSSRNILNFISKEQNIKISKNLAGVDKLFFEISQFCGGRSKLFEIDQFYQKFKENLLNFLSFPFTPVGNIKISVKQIYFENFTIFLNTLKIFFFFKILSIFENNIKVLWWEKFYFKLCIFVFIKHFIYICLGPIIKY